MKGVGTPARVGIVCAGLVVALSAAPVAAHGDEMTLVGAETLGDLDIAMWVHHDGEGQTRVLVSQARDGRPAAEPEPVLSLTGGVVTDPPEFHPVDGEPGWWVAEMPSPLLEEPGWSVVALTVDGAGRSLGVVIPLDRAGPWWVHLVIVSGLGFVVVLADRLLRQLFRAFRTSPAIERVGIHGNV